MPDTVDVRDIPLEATPALSSVDLDNYSRTLIERGARQLGILSQCALFVAVVVLVVFAISELAARDSMLTLLNARGSALKSDFVERTRINAPPVTASASDEVSRERLVSLRQIEAVDELKRAVQSLAALGAEKWDRSLRATERQFASISVLSASPAASAGREPPKSFSLSDLSDEWIMPILLYSSDQLLAIVVLGCGAIGAMISSLRSGHSLSLRSFVLGLASGFVAYLVIKGGKHIFLLQAQGEVVTFNPYGSAFSGLLAGLFTEKAHLLLSFLVDDLTNRVKAASANSATQSNPASPMPDKK